MKKTVLVFSLNLIVVQYSHTHKSFLMRFFLGGTLTFHTEITIILI